MQAAFLFVPNRNRNEPVSIRYTMLLLLGEVGFVHAAKRAAPVVGEIFKRGARSDAIVGIANLGVIDITAHVANVFFHLTSSQKNL